MNLRNIIMPIRNTINFILLILVNALVLILISKIDGDFSIGVWYNVFLIVISITIANALLWPFFKRYFMKFMIQTLGIGTIFINAIILYIACYFIPNVEVGFYASIKVPILLSIVTTVVTNLTNTNYYNKHLKNIVKHAINKKTDSKSYPGIIMLEIDGLSINILKKAIDKDIMPTVKEWINSNTHTLKEWETDLSSQTGASQAGILHGNNENIVAYRWVNKENNNQIIVSGKLSHAPLIEEKITNGNGLLVDGISISNMFSGDSKNAPLTSSKLGTITKINNNSLNTVFLHSYN